MSDATAFGDPYAAPGRGQRGRLTDVRPQGYQIEFDDEGNATAIPPADPQEPQQPANHFDNLAETMDPGALGSLVTEMLEAIEEDKENRSERDRQYRQGLDRTGMGSNVIGGANFPGASRAVHPLLLESSVDFGGAMMNEMLPPGGPCKMQVQGDENEAKDLRGKRIARWINYLFTEVMPSSYHEFEIGFTQCPLGGGFYTKTYIDDVGNPQISFVPIDHVYRPYSDGDFYNQPRITHAQLVDKFTFRNNVQSGLWLDVVDYDVQGGTVPERTATDDANDRIVGRDQPTQNKDGIREVWECSCLLMLNGDNQLKPYLLTIDVLAREALGLYRNWRENDETMARCIFLIEWPFWPWRGGYPVGLTHMIGSLSGAATGSLRALLDAALLNTTQSGVRLKGGSTAGGQNVTPRITEITEIQGSLAQDDIRKTYMPMEFAPPNATMLQLLSFLVDAGRGVVRSTYDDMDKFGAQTPVGTTQMFLEQGLRNLGAVHGRMHRAMRLLLKGIYQICQDTLSDVTVIDTFGELTVSAKDFQGPMPVIPVSDPRLWSDMQRKALAQTVITRASDPIAGALYETRKTESYFLKQMGVDNPDQFLKPNPQPQRTNAVAENVAASQGMPIDAFPGQDHEAHIRSHLDYMQSEFFGENAAMAAKFIPIMIDHIGKHTSLWYNDAMLEAATQIVREQTGISELTLQSFMGEGIEIGLDRLMAELSPEILAQAAELFADLPDAIEQARATLKRLAPPMPMDPSMVAQEDVQRQREADDKKHQAQVIDLAMRRRKDETEAQFKDRQLAMQQQKARADAQLKREQIEAQREKDRVNAAAQSETLHVNAQQQAADRAAQWTTEQADIAARDERNEDDNQTAIEVTRMKNESAEKTAKMAAAAAKARGAAQARARKGRGGLTTGTGGGDSG